MLFHVSVTAWVVIRMKIPITIPAVKGSKSAEGGAKTDCMTCTDRTDSMTLSVFFIHGGHKYDY